MMLAVALNNTGNVSEKKKEEEKKKQRERTFNLYYY